jgi:hypothetical protein
MTHKTFHKQAFEYDRNRNTPFPNERFYTYETCSVTPTPVLILSKNHPQEHMVSVNLSYTAQQSSIRIKESLSLSTHDADVPNKSPYKSLLKESRKRHSHEWKNLFLAVWKPYSDSRPSV